MAAAPIVLFVTPWSGSRFIDWDRAWLEGRYPVETASPARALLRLLLGRKVLFCYGWFCLPWITPLLIAASKLRGVEYFLCIGGVDTARLPGFGWPRRIWWRPLIRWCFRNAEVFTYSEAMRKEAMELAPGADPPVVPLRLSPFWYRPHGEKRPRKVLTVAPVTEVTMRQKGLAVLYEAARMMPDCEFEVVASSDCGLLPKLPNLKVSARLDDMGLRYRYWTAAVYAHLSEHEGFGCAALEAQACGCRLVMSQAAAKANPDLGGWVVNTDRISEVVRALRVALGDNLWNESSRGRGLDSLLGSKHST